MAEAESSEPAGAAAEASGGAAEAAGEAAPAASAPDDMTAELEHLQAELQALHDRHLRLAAEFDNYRRRIDRERMELHTRAQAELVKRLLDVLDDLQRVAHYNAEATSAQALIDGVGLVEKKLRHVLESAGLEPIDAEGEFFNPATMEALMTVPAEHPEEDEVVAEVLQKGYRFGNTLVRPARVRVKKYEG
ncbi:MAG: nucleotide exchange factor GrpE [Gemmatimonadetes bacterium]|nr:nucleotide exchange factor GrpE [Gemmatimonadota bacterium]